jgi:hypothetical protein
MSAEIPHQRTLNEIELASSGLDYVRDLSTIEVISQAEEIEAYLDTIDLNSENFTGDEKERIYHQVDAAVLTLRQLYEEGRTDFPLLVKAFALKKRILLKLKRLFPIEPDANFESFFDYQNPNFEKYKELQISLAHSGQFDFDQAPFSDYWYSILNPPINVRPPEDIDEIIEYLQKKLKGQMLLDLGCGQSVPSIMDLPQIFDLVWAADVGTYVGVDLSKSNPVPPQKAPFRMSKFDNESYYIEDDMLLRLARTPSNSVNTVINGIDDMIIQSDKYISALATEIVRTCKPGGIIFGRYSWALRVLENRILDGREPNLKVVNFSITGPKNHFDVDIFEKISG